MNKVRARYVCREARPYQTQSQIDRQNLNAYKALVARTGILKDYKDKQYYESEPQRRKRKDRESQIRNRNAKIQDANSKAKVEASYRARDTYSETE